MHLEQVIDRLQLCRLTQGLDILGEGNPSRQQIRSPQYAVSPSSAEAYDSASKAGAVRDILGRLANALAPDVNLRCDQLLAV